MEPKRLKKLVLKKDVISNLENEQMNHMRGGYGGTVILSLYGIGCSCAPVESCVPMQCPGDNDSRVTVCPTIGVGGCETRYLCY